MSLDGVEIRVFRAGDETQIIDGLNATGSAGVSLEDWSWSYPSIPEGRPIVVAVANGGVVAHIGGVVSPCHLGDRTVPALMLADVFALPTVGGAEKRNRLLADMLATFRTDLGGDGRFPMIYRLHAESGNGDPSWIPGGTAVELPPVTMLRRRHDARSRARRLAFRAEAARDWEPRLDDLWRRARRAYPCAAVRDAETVLHRHAGHPFVRRHRFLIFPRFSRHAVAFAVFETDQTCCRLVDLVWDHDEPGAIDLLSHLSHRLASQVGVVDERVLLGGDSDAVVRLQAVGFRPEDVLGGLELTVFALPDGNDVHDLASRSYITQTDLEPLRRKG